jgi:hypothetical protein
MCPSHEYIQSWDEFQLRACLFPTQIIICEMEQTGLRLLPDYNNLQARLS